MNDKRERGKINYLISLTRSRELEGGMTLSDDGKKNPNEIQEITTATMKDTRRMILISRN